jgi:hypothetical protein
MPVSAYWDLDDQEQERGLCLAWQETRGPSAEAPDRVAFGLSLSGVADTHIDIQPDGVRRLLARSPAAETMTAAN